ncbi:MAG: hypothetical protein KBF21_03095 [Thermoanaerobaculia bacterium]|nr:hypothetical protein [Thermoanaerobaculia bacterium]
MRVSSLVHVATMAVLVGQAVPPGFGQATAHSGQFQVNSFTTDSQYRPAIALDAQGRMVAVWQSLGAEIGDPDGSVQGQRYSAAGVAQGTQFQVNSATLSTQARPDVAQFPNGEFVVVWDSLSSPGTDSSGWSVQGQRFNADGSPLGTEFQVNTHSTGSQRSPRVAAGAAGEFVVVWQSQGSGADDTNGYSVQGQRYSGTGAPQGGEFQVNALTAIDQLRPSVAVEPGGNFWVVFRTNAAAGGDPDGSIQARFYNASGVPSEAQELTLNSSMNGSQQNPRIAAHSDGNFLAVWESFDSAGTDADLSIQAFYLSATGEPLGDEFQVNTFTTGDQTRPLVAAYDGGFVVSWQSQLFAGPDQTTNIRATQVGLGGDFAVNTLTAGEQQFSGIAADQRGNFVVVWNSMGSVGTDDSSYSIQAQLFDALFRDGFEWNASGRWSLTVP